MTQLPPSSTPIDDLWRAHRPRMLQLSLRMLSDLGDAEDVVQEAFARLARIDVDTLDDPEAWLVVVTGRLCLDRLRTRRRHPAVPLPDPSSPSSRAELADVASPDPADHVALVDSVTLSMHVVLERLSPAERTSFVLHDVFQLPFDEISVIVGRSSASCRQLASRARRSVRDAANGRRFAVEDDVQRRVAERFIAACTDGDLAGLLAVLDPNVDGTGDVAGEQVIGADLVGPGILRYLGPAVGPTLLHVPVGEGVGIVALRDHTVLALVVLTIEDARIVHVEALAGQGPRAAVGRVLGVE
jgi:RNA polymerase sigma-70 factor, ECF subfamily